MVATENVSPEEDRMRHFHRTLVALGLLAVGGSFYAAGCADDCADTLTCGEPPGTDSGSGGSDGSGGSGGSGGSTPLACIPKSNQEQNGVVVKDECGVFVRLAGDDLAAGTKSKPFATIARAIEVAKALPARRIYVCAESFAESLDIPSGIEIYGGLNCAGAWTYSGKRTTIAPQADLVPLRFIRENSQKIHLEDVDARAADAEQPGGSSIAAIADAVPLELVRSELFAGAGAPGEDGITPEGEVSPTSPNDVEIAGKTGNNACMGGGLGNVGPTGTMNPYCPVSISGSGGTGQETMGGNGGDGQPLPDPNPSKFGAGGVGAVSASGCQYGQKGQTGDEGTPGSGANKPTDLGSIDLAGYAGVNGTDGSIGTPGQGGGGGGAAKGKAGCYGAAGGSGGAGGCGGKGGTGGRAGGSSIALISVGATLLFTDVKLTASDAGEGGEGGEGQLGGVGGLGGMGGVPGAAGSGTIAACGGADGGFGGNGGKGGGGHGGHSIGIAWKTLAPTALPAGSITIGNAGNGGVGMDPDGNGAAGTAAEVLEIP
jgi:hypothetical protein